MAKEQRTLTMYAVSTWNRSAPALETITVRDTGRMWVVDGDHASIGFAKRVTPGWRGLHATPRAAWEAFKQNREKDVVRLTEELDRAKADAFLAEAELVSLM